MKSKIQNQKQCETTKEWINKFSYSIKEIKSVPFNEREEKSPMWRLYTEAYKSMIETFKAEIKEYIEERNLELDKETEVEFIDK